MCRAHIKKTGVTVATVPDSLRRDKSDDVNRANATQTSAKKSKNEVNTFIARHDGLGAGGGGFILQFI